MFGKWFGRVALLISGIILLPGVASAADYAGKYEGMNLSVTLTPDGGAYGGEIRLGEHRSPLPRSATIRSARTS